MKIMTSIFNAIDKKNIKISDNTYIITINTNAVKTV